MLTTNMLVSQAVKVNMDMLKSLLNQMSLVKDMNLLTKSLEVLFQKNTFQQLMPV